MLWKRINIASHGIIIWFKWKMDCQIHYASCTEKNDAQNREKSGISRKQFYGSCV